MRTTQQVLSSMFPDGYKEQPTGFKLVNNRIDVEFDTMTWLRPKLNYHPQMDKLFQRFYSKTEREMKGDFPAMEKSMREFPIELRKKNMYIVGRTLEEHTEFPIIYTSDHRNFLRHNFQFVYFVRIEGRTEVESFVILVVEADGLLSAPHVFSLTSNDDGIDVIFNYRQAIIQQCVTGGKERLRWKSVDGGKTWPVLGKRKAEALQEYMIATDQQEWKKGVVLYNPKQQVFYDPIDNAALSVHCT